jgi:large subunit ribosomal protein L1
MKLSKNKKKQIEGINFNKSYSVLDAVNILKDKKYSKFDESIEVSINTGIDSKQSDQNVRGSFVPPHGLGKKVQIAVFAQGKAAEEAKALGVKHVGGDDLVNSLQQKIDVDVIIATPDMMAVVSKIAKVLGPKGLMPNPKTGTVTNDIKGTIENINKGLVAYKNDKAGTIHAAIGKISFDNNKIAENITSFIDEIKKIKPSGVKGNFVNSVYVSSTMGVGLKLEV